MSLQLVKPKCSECGSEDFMSCICERCELNLTKDKNQLQHALEAEQNAYHDLEQEAVSYRDENDKLKAQVKELKEKLSLYEWRDIKDAPKDGTVIFALEDENQFLAFYDRQNHGWWSLSGTLPVDEIHPDKWCHTPPTQEGEE